MDNRYFTDILVKLDKESRKAKASAKDKAMLEAIGVSVYVVWARYYGLKLNELHSGVNFTQNIWRFGICILTLRCNYYTRARLIWKKISIATAIRIRRSQLTA